MDIEKMTEALQAIIMSAFNIAASAGASLTF